MSNFAVCYCNGRSIGYFRDQDVAIYSRFLTFCSLSLVSLVFN